MLNNKRFSAFKNPSQKKTFFYKFLHFNLKTELFPREKRTFWHLTTSFFNIKVNYYD